MRATGYIFCMRSKPLTDRVALSHPQTGPTVNGLDRVALNETLGKLRAQRNHGKIRYRARNRWLDGGHTRTTIRDFDIDGVAHLDRARPHVLESEILETIGGNDNAMGPLEMLLAALASCITTTLVWQASVRGEHLDAVETDIEGDIDIAGSLGIDDNAQPGYRELRISVNLESDVQDSVLRELVDVATRLSPVLGTIGCATTVSVTTTAKPAVPGQAEIV